MSWILLDRDGVINEDSDAYIKSPDEWVPIPGSLEAIRLLNQNGYRVAVLTNQSGIARGLFDLATLERIHAKMRAATEEAGGHIEHIFYCPHGPEDGCACRKPATGLFEQFAGKYRAELDGLPAVGDSLRDLQAAERAGCSPILVETGKGLRTLKRNPELDVPSFSNLYEAAQYLLYTQG
ncbi:D-glycero-beta-D-manno-heptose 1,7-bisphosphate 7-phosphatase [Methylococcus sp. EFPC2]|uniref:D-glycero-beta-D-manno-heptose 1,7-bisphosphate 7-phosphatase n=1 Tax=Methylococcus sp. EFPC2 TaxID=2812648 RepID=UPI0019686D63|nr:D-glycero-beta-D-manno-heptose 1,7-bisphosphate 7-phosphatase [Methylococcus sp. EFPC2]QSA97462.1 D-glycero-beta-D-manno-heptose 1,7-bisphosphate 7-phosphatase [Methylococcus sp. EFPC2]